MAPRAEDAPCQLPRRCSLPRPRLDDELVYLRIVPESEKLGLVCLPLSQFLNPSRSRGPLVERDFHSPQPSEELRSNLSWPTQTPKCCRTVRRCQRLDERRPSDRPHAQKLSLHSRSESPENLDQPVDQAVGMVPCRVANAHLAAPWQSPCGRPFLVRKDRLRRWLASRTCAVSS